MPAPITPFQFFEQDPTVTLTLANDLGVCWSTAFQVADTKKNSGEQFVAKRR
jgi:hypothetical protein